MSLLWTLDKLSILRGSVQPRNGNGGVPAVLEGQVLDHHWSCAKAEGPSSCAHK
jgi:hypothetical protein